MNSKEIALVAVAVAIAAAAGVCGFVSLACGISFNLGLFGGMGFSWLSQSLKRPLGHNDNREEAGDFR